MMRWTKGEDYPPSDGRGFGRAPTCVPPWSADTSAEVWHSTPVKKENGGSPLLPSPASLLTSFKMDNSAKQWSRNTPPVPADPPCPPICRDNEFPVSDVSGSTVQRQRRELQLLMAELKDRDRELNVMAASHHKHLHAWEQDRQKVLAVEQRCARLHDELQKRNEVIRVLTKRACVVETKEKEAQEELSSARQQLCEVEQKHQNASQKCQDFEDKNQSLNSTVMSLSSQVGSLQVREEELSSMLKLKDKDVTEASSHVFDLTERLRQVETSLTESRSRENKLQRDLEENKRRYRETKHEITNLKEELQQQVTQSSTQREEIIRLKQELQLLRRDIVLSGEGDSWRDELLELAHSKQERTMSELRCLRQVCENQRNDLQLLQLNLESARETLRERNSQGLISSQDELRCVCVDNRSPSSIRAKNSSTVPADSSPLPAAVLQSAVNLDLDLSAHLKETEDRLSSCSLQQLLEESRQLFTNSEHNALRLHSSVYNCGTNDHFLCSHRCPTSPHQHQHQHQHLSPPTHKTGETPPNACLRRSSILPCGRPDAD
ncbi:coiled-coil domain-containing protein 62 [Scomber scombrus]|uniref:coiled-coil domain-containing protein 62 n=1 Tax=Scomber scombrus TaxID=13677 RepID=UPI002DDB0300|nr:coiled-coil domain-containing protein 62 [Scomber scombrus]